ncbi:uncharacterized protein LOC115884584 [Sitophilus oryzae]|uniref:Uncharacterized protein LOC115884584 n=1 Tax=Sitophilus oryzae TaxID=7048 RepID=A0A6J2Y5H2_SITOR|nr:uncharacterized protein LOC115884584 [Sitophilus oryzae]
MQFGTWNVQGHIRNKREIIIKDLEKLELDIITLTETKKKGSGSEIIGNYLHYYSGVPKDQRAKRGVSVLIKNKFKKNITDWEGIDENIIRLNLKLRNNRLDEKLIEDSERPFHLTYNNIIDSIHGAAEEALGIKARRKSRKLWWTELVEEKKILYFKWLNSKSELDKRTYNDKKNEVRRMVKEEKNKVWDGKCKEINTYIGGRRNTEVWRFIKTTTTENQESALIEIITNKEWVKYYSKLLSENRPEYQEPPQPEINIEGEEIYVDTNKIKTAIMSLKNGRACGPVGPVYAELIKSGSKKLFTMLTNIVNLCLNGHPVPEQWKKAYISSIYKKGSRKDPNNYRKISVTSTMSRLYGRILRNLIEEEYSSYEEEEQNVQ